MLELKRIHNFQNIREIYEKGDVHLAKTGQWGEKRHNKIEIIIIVQFVDYNKDKCVIFSY